LLGNGSGGIGTKRVIATGENAGDYGCAERESKSSVLEVSVDDAAVVEVVDGIEDGADNSDDAMQNSKPSWNLN